MKPLSKEEQNDVSKLTSAYASFWAHPFVEIRLARPWLRETAEIVVRLRSHLRELAGKDFDLSGPIEGASHEYLHTVHRAPGDPNKFIDDLVHATFTNEWADSGYVAPASEKLVNEFIAKYRAAKNSPPPTKKSKKEELAEVIDEASLLWSKHAEQVEDEEEISRLLKTFTRAKSLLEVHDAKQEESSSVSEAEAEEEPKKEAAAPEEEEDAEAAEKAQREAMRASLEEAQLMQEKDMIAITKVGDKVNEVAQNIRLLSEEAEAVDDSKKAVQLKRKAAMYTDLLVRALEELDTIHSTPAVRPKRKAKVTEVQKLLDDVDSLKHRLVEMIATLPEPIPEPVPEPEPEPEAEEPEPEPEAEEPEPEPQAEAEDDEAEDKAEEEEEEADLATLFSQLKLEPRFDVREGRDSFVISAHIPQVDRESLTVALNDAKDTLTVSGVRLPTPEQVQTMRERLAQGLAANPTWKLHHAETSEDELLLRFASGRFGSFKESWKVSAASADVDKIQGTYKDGNLVVVIPKRVQPRGRRRGNPFFDSNAFW